MTNPSRNWVVVSLGAISSFAEPQGLGHVVELETNGRDDQDPEDLREPVVVGLEPPVVVQHVRRVVGEPEERQEEGDGVHAVPPLRGDRAGEPDVVPDHGERGQREDGDLVLVESLEDGVRVHGLLRIN
jgi:hypothetical protein